LRRISSSDLTALQNVESAGVEVHKFSSFAGIKQRVQIDAKALIFPGNGLVPLGRLEVAVAGIVAPGIKGAGERREVTRHIANTDTRRSF
jgi:hypothetical protein